MTKLSLLFLLLPSIAFSQEYEYKILRVIDGDTVVISADFLPPPLPPEMSLRILGIDTPEKGGRAECDSENNLSQKASAFTKHAIENAHTTKVEVVKFDKFGGRLDGNIIIDGVSLADLLIKNNLARPYFGDKKQSWCRL